MAAAIVLSCGICLVDGLFNNEGNILLYLLYLQGSSLAFNCVYPKVCEWVTHLDLQANGQVVYSHQRSFTSVNAIHTIGFWIIGFANTTLNVNIYGFIVDTSGICAILYVVLVYNAYSLCRNVRNQKLPTYTV